ncbi:palindromic element RPE1 domain-containing protein [Candidatus Tisiphia endosymbiont of Hybos culiciformis]|uniref:palindromic element RPE1 domain-containing protein n=1 Tax=Candidatus Tisiphia endosymbiont of Hybos culiciformis TaxID=3139331 RepID=UPI003CCAA485
MENDDSLNSYSGYRANSKPIHPRYYSTLLPERISYNSVFDLLGSSKWDVWRAVSRQAYADSPSLSTLWRSFNPQHIIDPEFQDIAEYSENYNNKLTKEDFEQKYSDSGLKYDPNFTNQLVEDILERKKQREINEYIIAAGKGGLVEAIGKFGAEIVFGNLSVINIAASFVPIGGQARWAAAALKYGILPTTLAKGFVCGAVGQAAIEPFLYNERLTEQRPYDLSDSLINIIESGLFGATLHGLGYSAKYLRDKLYLHSNKLRPEIETLHPIVDSQLKENIDAVLKETFPQERIIGTEQVDSQIPTSANANAENSSLSRLTELQAKKLQLITAAEQQYPLYSVQQRKIAELQQHMHDQFGTNGKIEQVPKWFLDILLEEEGKLQQLYQEHINNPEFQEYLTAVKQLDQQIINNLRRQQWETKGYDLSPEDLYIARKQLEEGKHINLENPQEAESFYHGDDEKFDTSNAAPNLQEHLASLEVDIAHLPEQQKVTYQAEAIKQDVIYQRTEEILRKVKQGADPSELEELFKTLALVDQQLVDKLKTIHKEFVGQERLDLLERDKKIDMFIDDFKNEHFVKKRNNALNLLKMAAIERFIRNHTNKVAAIKEYLRQVDLRQQTTAKELLFGLTRDLEKAGVIHEFGDVRYQDAIIQELWNISHPDKKPTGSERAMIVAQIINKWQTAAINRANLAGGYIIPLEGYITKQEHNSLKLREAGYEPWLKFIYPLLDHQKIAKLNDKIDYKAIFNNLASSIHLKDTDQYLNIAFTHIKGSNLADVASASRKLHFKSPEAWLAYQKEFGNYVQNDFVDQIISPLIKSRSFIADSIVSNLNILGRSIGVMESMGCNPELMLQSIKGTFTRELQELATKDPAISPPSKLAYAEGFEGDSERRTAAYSNVREDSSTASTYKSPAEVEFRRRALKQLAILSNPNSFVNQLDLMLGVKPQIPSVDRILGAYRSWKCMANLGKVVLSSIPDMITFVSELQNNGIPLMKSYANILQVSVTGFNGEKKKELASLLGVAVDSLLGHSHSRFAGEYPVSGGVFKLTNAFFKLNFMEWWDNAWKSTVGNLLSHNLASQVNKPFNSLYHNLQILLNRYGINESNWHLYQHLVQQIENKPYLIPDMALLPDHLLDQHLQQQSGNSIISPINRDRLKQDLTNNLRRYLLDRVDTAIATPHTAERNAVLFGNLGIKAGSPAAAVIKCIMQFKTFAYTYITRPLKSVTIDQIPTHQQIGSGNLLDLGTWKDIAKSMRNPTSIKMLLQLLPGSIGLGYLSINAKRLFDGKEWLDPNEEGVFMASLLQGGGLGLFGDFFFNEYDSYNNLLKALAGTMGSDIIDFGTIVTLIKNGEVDKAEELLKKSLQRNIPGRNLFYLQPALCGFHDCHSLNW